MYKNIYFFVGTTAELIKLAPVMRELKARNRPFRIIASNQNVLHFEELKPLLGDTKAHHILKIKKNKNIKNIYVSFVYWLTKTVGNYYLYFRREFREVNKKESVVIVHGDTISALLGAVVARVNRVRLVHIEAGLRSYNFLEPFPEEISRYIISWLASLHFAPNAWAVKNLRWHPGVKINTKANTVSESVALATKENKPSKFMPKTQKYYILVVHRQEHTLFKKSKTKELINSMVGHATPDMKCVFIMHKLTRDYLEKQNMYHGIANNKNVIMPPRLPYLEFINLMKGAEFIATDGGSNQEEASYLGTPCLVLRNVAERTEGIGKNVVISKGKLDVVGDFLANYKKYRTKPSENDESPSKIIVDHL